MPIKWQFLLLFILVAIISFSLGAITNESQKTNSISNSLSSNQNLPAEKYTEVKSFFIGEYESPFDKTKKIIVKENTWEDHIIEVINGEKQFKSMTAIGPHSFYWSRNSNNVAFVDHEVSNHDSVYIINIGQNTHVQAEGAAQFVQSQQNPKDYSHVYTGIVGWYDNESLIVSVSGHPDSSDFRPKSQLFLVNSSSGKVIKRVL